MTLPIAADTAAKRLENWLKSQDPVALKAKADTLPKKSDLRWSITNFIKKR